MTKTSFPETNGGRLLRRGRTFDPECGRATDRLRVGSSILHGLGVTPTYRQHDATCMRSPEQRYNRVFGVEYFCSCPTGSDPEPTWPDWVSGATFDLAYRLADETQTERGNYHRDAAYAAKAARVDAERAARRAS